MENSIDRKEAAGETHERHSGKALTEIGNNALQKSSAINVNGSPYLCNRQSDQFQILASATEEQWFNSDRSTRRDDKNIMCSTPKGKISHAELQALFLKSKGSLKENPKRSPCNTHLATTQEHNNWTFDTSPAASPKSQDLSILKSLSSLSLRCSPKHSHDNKSVDFSTKDKNIKNDDDQVDPQLARLQQKVAILSKLHKIIYDMDDVSLYDDDMTATTAADSFAGKSQSTSGSLLGDFLSSGSVSASVESDLGEISESEPTLDSPRTKSIIGESSTQDDKSSSDGHEDCIALAKPRIVTSRATTPMTRHDTSRGSVKKNIPISPSLCVTPRTRGGSDSSRSSFTFRPPLKAAAKLATTPRIPTAPPLASPKYKDAKAKKSGDAKKNETAFRFDNLHEYGKKLLKFNQERIQRQQELKNERYGPTLNITARNNSRSAATSASTFRSKSASSFRSKPVLTPNSTRSNTIPSPTSMASPLNITVTSPKYENTDPQKDSSTFRFDNLHEYGKGLQKAKRERCMLQEIKEKQRAIEMELQFKRRYAAKMKKARELARSEDVCSRLYNSGTRVNNVSKSKIDGKARRAEIERKAKLREKERKRAFRN